jgi:hypothetical protein
VRLRILLRKVVYWLAVIVISVALLVLLVLFFEARDSSDLDKSQAPSRAAQVALGPARVPAVL